MSSFDKYLRSSANYIWNTSLVLGKGATASVYQGMDKRTGDFVAVKFFIKEISQRPPQVQRREYEVLRKINHVNIVKLFAIEEETETKNNVLIMELCTGGSLFNILEDPINGFGLEEKEFLLVLEHLAAGIMHLKELNIIHRDLKPGNIMKFIAEDGRSIYKLTDFGAARELEEDQKFMSIYGTEEYLFPGMFLQGLLTKTIARSFSAKVDLWSIGVTLFHVATGSLPFRPYGGRKNPPTMYKITTEKQSGIISGIQHSENGEIEWSSTLPSTCLLCPSLQEKITPLLAGLLECNENKMWTFDQFFQTVTHILSHKPVYVFCVNKVCLYKLYLQPNEKLTNLKTKLASKDFSQIPVASQFLIWNKLIITDIDTIFLSTEQNPVMLLNSDATCIKATNLITDLIPTQIKFPEILNVTKNSGDQDAQLAKACASIAYCIQRNIVECSSYFEFMNEVPQQFVSLIESNMKILEEKKKSCSHLISSLKDRIEYTQETTANLERCFSPVPNIKIPETRERLNLRLKFNELIEKSWRELLPKIMDMEKRANNLSERWSKEPKSFHSNMSSAKARSEHLCSKIRDSWLFLHKNKSFRVVNGNEQVYKLEKLRIDTNCKKLSKLLYEDTHQGLNGLVERLDDWYNDAHVAFVQTSCLLEELARLMNFREKIICQLNEAIAKQHQEWQALFTKISRINEAQHKNIPNDKLHHQSSSYFPDQKLDGLYLMDEDTLTECSHNPGELIEQLNSLRETQRLVSASLSRNQNLVSELMSMSTKKSDQAIVDTFKAY